MRSPIAEFWLFALTSKDVSSVFEISDRSKQIKFRGAFKKTTSDISKEENVFAIFRQNWSSAKIINFVNFDISSSTNLGRYFE